MSSMLIGYDKNGNTEVTLNVKVTITVPAEWGLYSGELRQKGSESMVAFNTTMVVEQLHETLVANTDTEDEYPWRVTAVQAV